MKLKLFNQTQIDEINSFLEKVLNPTIFNLNGELLAIEYEAKLESEGGSNE